MPRLIQTGDTADTKFTLPPGCGSYGYSGTSLARVRTQNVTLVTIGVDISSSTSRFRDLMAKTVEEAIGACRKSPVSSNIMVRALKFATSVEEVHGFIFLNDINLDIYKNITQGSGGTALYDAYASAVSAAKDYGESLANKDKTVNSIAFIITDGADNRSSLTLEDVGRLNESVVSSEDMESHRSILIGVNTTSTLDEAGARDLQGLSAYDKISKYLEIVTDKGGFSQYIDVENFDAKAGALAAEFISKSVSATGVAAGTGSPSAPVIF